jgi:DNA-binding MarR family transcriptional regulator
LMKKDIGIIIENQNNIRKQINILEENVKKIGNNEKIQVITNESQLFSISTETEMIILQFLMTEGAKTAPEVEHKIGKTREHTARLMKKLWQEGYIERDTHRIPYIYRINENFKKMEIKDIHPI